MEEALFYFPPLEEEEESKDLEEEEKIGSAKLELKGLITSRHADVQSQLLNEIKEKLFGRSVTAKSSIMFVHDDLWFFPKQLQLL